MRLGLVCACAAAALVAAEASQATAQRIAPVRLGTGPVTVATFAQDAFGHAFSFGGRGFAPSATGSTLFGAAAPCLLGESCQESAGGLERLAGGAYQFAANLNVPQLLPPNQPGFVVDNPDGSTASLVLSSAVAAPVDAFYILLRGPQSRGSVRLFGTFLVTDFETFGGVDLELDLTTLAPGETRYGFFRVPGNLQSGFALVGAIDTAELTGTSPDLPSFELYFGSTVIPEPRTVALIGLGLVGLAGAARRRGRGMARRR